MNTKIARNSSTRTYLAQKSQALLVTAFCAIFFVRDTLSAFMAKTLRLLPYSKEFIKWYRRQSEQDGRRGKGFRSILFIDLDNTVMLGSFIFVVYNKACGEIAEAAGRSVKDIRSLVAHENQKRRRNPDISAVDAMDWDDIVETVAKRVGAETKPSVLELVREYAKPPHITELDQAGKVLGRLKREDRAIVAATNGLAKYQLPVLEALGLHQVFDDILSPDTSGVLKDDKAFYGEWRYRAPIRIMVGDSYRYDVQASHGHGFEAVWYSKGRECRAETIEPRVPSDPYPEASQQPPISIQSLQELPRVVRRIEVRVWLQKARLLPKDKSSSKEQSRTVS